MPDQDEKKIEWTNRQKAAATFRVSLVLTALMYVYLFALSFITTVPTSQTSYFTATPITIPINSWWDPLIFLVLANTFVLPVCIMEQCASIGGDNWWRHSVLDSILAGLGQGFVTGVGICTFCGFIALLFGRGFVTGLSVGMVFATILFMYRMALVPLEILVNLAVKHIPWRWFLAEDKK